MVMETKHRSAFLEQKTLTEDGSFVGYGSVFDIEDSYRDIIVKGAFVDTIKEYEGQGRMPALLWQHDSREPIGVINSLSEDGKGLVMNAKFALGVQKGREAYELLKAGAINGLSIGYSVKKERYDKQKGIRYLDAVNLWEVSLVTFPANDAARISDVKSKPETIREFEEFLRDAGGYSRSEAAIIATKGFKALPSLRDAASDELIATINSVIEKIRS